MSKLGRGLEALINSGPESVDKTTGITTVKLEYIKPNRFQPRKTFNREKLEELAKSLKENGLIQPIIVTKKATTEYELIAGERRLEAAKLANFDEIPVIIRSVSPKEQLQFAIIENVQREDLNAIEEALAYRQLSEEFGMTHSQIAEIVGKERVTISNSIRILKLSSKIQKMILEKKLSSGHARAILQVKKELQEQFAEYIIKNGLSVRKAETEAKRIMETDALALNSKKEKEISFPEIADYEKKLKDIFKAKIKISHQNNKGKIIFYYRSAEEFNKLLEKLEKLK